jgi:hypothetical protein
VNPITWLQNVQRVLGPAYLPFAGVILIVMAIALAGAYNNPGLKAAIKEHIGTLILAGFMALAGAGALAWFFQATGLPTG